MCQHLPTAHRPSSIRMLHAHLTLPFPCDCRVSIGTTPPMPHSIQRCAQPPSEPDAPDAATLDDLIMLFELLFADTQDPEDDAEHTTAARHPRMPGAVAEAPCAPLQYDAPMMQCCPICGSELAA